VYPVISCFELVDGDFGVKKKTYMLGLLAFALCASLTASADTFGDACDRDDFGPSYTGPMTCEASLVGSGLTAIPSPVAMSSGRTSDQDSPVRMDIIGNSGETSPEPSSLILLGGGLMGAFVTMRRGLTR
jgi:hypothetical protein